MMKIIEGLGELIKMYPGTPAPKATGFKRKCIGYALAGLLLISAVGFGYLALYKYLETIWQEPYTSLILSLASLGVAIILFVISSYPKSKPAPALPLEGIIKGLITFGPQLLGGAKVLNIPKKAWVSLLTIAGFYILLHKKHDK